MLKKKTFRRFQRNSVEVEAEAEAEAEVVTDTDTQTYVGLASTTFKLRYGNHKESFKNEGSKSKSTLSKHIWGLKNKGVNYETKFKIIGRAQPFSTRKVLCDTCTN